MNQVCKFCGKTFLYKKKQSMGGHVSSCKMNPNSKNKQSKQAKTKTKDKLRLNLTCKKCGIEFEQDVKEHIYKNNKHKKYCSRSCANSRTHSEETKQRIKSSLLSSDKFWKVQHDRTTKATKTIICQNPSCSKTFSVKNNWKNRKYCSLKCSAYKSGGQRLYSGRSRYHGGWYNNVWMDSSWEMSLAKRLDYLGIVWKRDNSLYFEYKDIDGNLRKYYPDFYLPNKNLYIEVKGYWTEQTKHKIQSVVDAHKINLITLESLDSIESFYI